MKLLIIEDEQAFSDSIFTYLDSEHFVCETAYNFAAAMEKIAIYDYACIILDTNLPGGSGLDILKELKASHKTDGVLVISARNSVDDKVYGLKTVPMTTLPNLFIYLNWVPESTLLSAGKPLTGKTSF